MEQQFISPIKMLHDTNPETLHDCIRGMQKLREAIECFNAIEFNASHYANFETFCKAKAERKQMLTNLFQVFDYFMLVASKH
jgi:4-hydroxy-3-methylbut-2-enyl diphosphate reductase IspH